MVVIFFLIVVCFWCKGINTCLRHLSWVRLEQDLRKGDARAIKIASCLVYQRILFHFLTWILAISMVIILVMVNQRIMVYLHSEWLKICWIILQLIILILMEKLVELIFKKSPLRLFKLVIPVVSPMLNLLKKLVPQNAKGQWPTVVGEQLKQKWLEDMVVLRDQGELSPEIYQLLKNFHGLFYDKVANHCLKFSDLMAIPSHFQVSQALHHESISVGGSFLYINDEKGQVMYYVVVDELIGKEHLNHDVALYMKPLHSINAELPLVTALLRMDKIGESVMLVVNDQGETIGICERSRWIEKFYTHEE
jgi:CBS domain containing-hemolysin-like protein